MARAIPALSEYFRESQRNQNEWRTLNLLCEQLNDQFQVFHSLHWVTSGRDKTFMGEIDFIILAPDGRMICIEQKNGYLNEGPGGLTKRYGLQDKSVEFQLTRNISNLLDAFQARLKGKPDLDFVLYCPDFEVTNKAKAGIPSEQIIDAPQSSNLAIKLINMFESRPCHKSCLSDSLDIADFLTDQLEVKFDIGYISDIAKTAYIESSGSLSQIIRRMSGQPFRLLIQAVAGSGKTQLALDEIKAAKQQGKSSLYVCYNRNLAEDMRRCSDDVDTVLTFHELCRRVFEETGESFDPENDPTAFQRSEDIFLAAIDKISSIIDVLIIDEAQDFEAKWIEALVQMTKPDGRILALQDINQNIYGRETYSFDNWMRLDYEITYRCPPTIVDLINELQLCNQYIESQSAVYGLEVAIEIYDHRTQHAVIAATNQAVNSLLSDGHVPEDIAVLSLAGAKHSEILQEDQLGSIAVKKISEHRTPEGNLIWSDGNLLVDTIRRFKGRSANCVVLTELDFDHFDDTLRRLLFVGLTRARLGVAIVISERSYDLLAEASEGGE